MPVTFLAHQAPVLPLKRRWPQLDGVAMVAGTVTPDLARTIPPGRELIYKGQPIWWDGHAPVQALTAGLLVGLFITWVTRRLILPRLAGYLPDLGPFHLRDLRLVGLARHPWWMVVIGVMIGTVTHLLIDIVTHTDRGVVLPGFDVHVADLAGKPVTVAGLFQGVASLGLSVVAVWQMWEIGRRRQMCLWHGVEPTTPAMPSNLWLVRASICVIAVAAGILGLSRVSQSPATAVLTASVLGWMGLCLIAALCPRGRDG